MANESRESDGDGCGECLALVTSALVNPAPFMLTQRKNTAAAPASDESTPAVIARGAAECPLAS
jgi:hypothetical protein